MTNDLVITYRYDDLMLEITHEGKSGDLALLQGTILQSSETWRDMVSQAFYLASLEETVVTEVEIPEEDNKDDLP